MSEQTYYFWRCHWDQGKVIEFMLAHFGICKELQPRSWRRRLIGKTYVSYYAPRWKSMESATRLRQDLVEFEQKNQLPYHFWHTFLCVLKEENVGFVAVQSMVADPPFERVQPAVAA
jgi:hypothetical protein